MSGTAPDPYAVGAERWLEALAREWGDQYLVSLNGSRWYAIKRDGSGDALIENTPDELAEALAADVAAAR